MEENKSAGNPSFAVMFNRPQENITIMQNPGISR
jgi:hypothetical protein